MTPAKSELQDEHFSAHGSEAAKARPSNPFQPLVPLMKDPDVVSLVGGAPLPSLFPIESLCVKLKDGSEVILDGQDANSAQRYAPFAQDGLLRWCSQQVQSLHKPPGRWTVQMSAGSMSAIDITLDNLLDPGSTLLIEEFTFCAALDAMKSSRVNLVTVKGDRDGMIPESLDECCRSLQQQGIKPRAVFIIPKGQNPTGTCLSEERYHAIYAIACKFDFIIVEDDPYFYLQFCKQGGSESDGLPGLDLGTSFLSCDTQERVIRMDSFSKLVAPGFRLGWVTGPPHLMKFYALHSYSSSQWGSSLSMKVLAAILTSWSEEQFTNLILSTQGAYKYRRDAVLDAMDKHLTGLAEWHPPAAGFFLWVRVECDRQFSEDMLREFMAESKVVTLSGSVSCPQPTSHHHFRISYNLDDVELLKEGVRRFGIFLMALQTAAEDADGFRAAVKA
eukprot:CAMPEP_0114233518 /NCGR_PEP_ID=MMETSP0058-20121206/5208_1 /TAXON_ID=36894 /ORGANISM="Pyramimonas parkeae, CCMP726" /LENGTH=445 /DNA_ID=CAMNT_0001345115 /DNA_START=103 /DNA_END=1440 /DNA_ORIENTATION=-